MKECHLKPSLTNHIKTLQKNKFKKAITSDCSYIVDGHLTSIQHAIDKRLDQIAPMKTMVHGNNKPHMTSRLRKATQATFQCRTDVEIMLI